MNIQETYGIKNIILITIKIIFHYQVRQESCILFFKKGRKQIRNKNKNNEYMSNFIFLQKKKNKNMRVKN